jgi:hypothetical protein
MDNINDDFVDSVITNLKILNVIQINEKLCIRKGHLQIDRDSNVQFVKRWVNRDSREVTMNFIKELLKNINTIFNKTKTISDEYSIWILSRILIEMDTLDNGLNNLKTTYSADPVTTVVIDNFIIKLKELSKNGRKLLI